MKKCQLGICILALFCASLQAATRYISPTGSDAAAGTQSAPWGTFEHAVGQLYPGDVLVVMDGTYDGSNSGYIWVENVNGTAASPVTIRAQNERKAWIKGDGYIPIYVRTSSHVIVDGLRISNLDLATNPTGNVIVYRSNHITVKRCLLYNSNRLVNNVLLQLSESKSILAEENEFYNWTGLGINFNSDDSCVIRRNYFNRRGYAVTDYRWAQQAGIQVYPGENSHNIIENNISENTELGFTEQTIGPSRHNRFLGNIAIGGPEGSMAIVVKARDQYGSPPAYSPTDDTIKDFISVGTAYGFYGRGGNRTNIINSSFLDAGESGVSSDVENNVDGGNILEDGITASVFGRNILVTGGQYAGFAIREQGEWGFDYVNAFGSPQYNYDPQDDPHYTHATQVNPAMGTCIAWIPAGSPMKGAGANGEDIGANVLYRYENGVLTNQPLWDPSTGKFPCGAVVAGVNDIPGQSCFDVHARLNINRNGCPFPAGYPTSSEISGTPTNAVSGSERGFLSILPNLAGSSISIKTDLNHPATVEIYNLQGKRVASLTNVRGTSIQWHRGDQPAGVYFVRASSRGITATAKALIGN